MGASRGNDAVLILLVCELERMRYRMCVCVVMFYITAILYILYLGCDGLRARTARSDFEHGTSAPGDASWYLLTRFLSSRKNLAKRKGHVALY